MNPAQKALWFIESHLAEELTLDEVAAIGGVSRFHMVRAFAAATGLSVMRYVRARRLRDHFGVTPEAVRSAKRLDHIKLQEPILMDSSLTENLQAPRFETSKPLLIAGISERYNHENGAGIPGQWQRFQQSVDNIPGRIGHVAYGVCCNGDDAGNFDYIAGVEVADFSDLPREFSSVRIPEQRYAVFTHREHISTIRRTINTIWNHWLPASGFKVADAPNFERYDDKFDPLTGNGGLEIWVPVRD
jgi:AraC family transcriptional regulator